MLALEPSRVATTGVAIGAPVPIIRHRFGGNLRAARTVPESPTAAHHLRVPRMFRLPLRSRTPGSPTRNGRRSASSVSVWEGAWVVRPGVAPGNTGAIDPEEEIA